MNITIESLHRELMGIKLDLDFIKNLLSERFELSAEARNALREARETPESEYVDLQ